MKQLLLILVLWQAIGQKFVKRKSAILFAIIDKLLDDLILLMVIEVRIIRNIRNRGAKQGLECEC